MCAAVFCNYWPSLPPDFPHRRLISTISHWKAIFITKGSFFSLLISSPAATYSAEIDNLWGHCQTNILIRIRGLNLNIADNIPGRQMINEALLPRVSVIFLFYLENWALSTGFCFSHLYINLWIFGNTYLSVICVKREKMPIMYHYQKPYFYLYALSPALKAVSIWRNKSNEIQLNQIIVFVLLTYVLLFNKY